MILVQQQCPCHRELLVAGDLVGEGIILGMLKAFIKELNVIVAR